MFLQCQGYSSCFVYDVNAPKTDYRYSVIYDYFMVNLGAPTMFFITHYKKHHTNICLKLFVFFCLDTKERKSQD